MGKQAGTLFWRCALVPAALAAGERLAAEAVLGRFPLCEASSASLVTCPGGEGECLLVGDNEQGRALYLFPIRNRKLDADGQRPFDMHLGDDREISDIEAIAGLSDHEMLVFASHSRNSRCEVKPKRRQFGKVELSTAETVVVDTLRSDQMTCEHLFGKRDLDAPINAACAAIEAAERKAGQIEDDLKSGKIDEQTARARCDAAGAYNAEGAVVLPATQGSAVWIGLRAPLLAVHPLQAEKQQLAVLLHMKDPRAYAFDRVAFIDLGGRGVRDLASDATSVWVIAGPPEDKEEPFQLRRFPQSALDGSKVIEADLIGPLPPSSEGLAITGDTAYVVIDGDAGKGGKKSGHVCKQPARFEILPLPGNAIDGTQSGEDSMRRIAPGLFGHQR